MRNIFTSIRFHMFNRKYNRKESISFTIVTLACFGPKLRKLASQRRNAKRDTYSITLHNIIVIVKLLENLRPPNSHVTLIHNYEC